jgi:hypothetical protein
MTFAADSHEAVRLGRVVRHGPQACHPIFDFVRALLSSLEAGVTRVVLEDVGGEGSYPPDAIALALRMGIPIYATHDALAHAEPSPPPPADAVSEWLERVRRSTSDRPPRPPERRAQANIEKSSAFSVMNSSSAGMPSRVLATARRMAGTMSSGSVTRSP